MFVSTILPERLSLGYNLLDCFDLRLFIIEGPFSELNIFISLVPAINPLGSTIKAKLKLDVSSAINLPVPAKIER